MSLRSLSRCFKVLNVYPTRPILCGCKQDLFYSMKVMKPLPNIQKFIDPETGEERKKKTTQIQKITLLSGDNSISIISLEEATKLAKRRDLKLVKIVDLDTKTQRPLYKLMTGSEYHAEDLKQRELRKLEKQKSFIKGEKVVLLNGNISEHDLQTYANKIEKWIGKMYEVRATISGDSAKCEKVYDFLVNHLKEARFLQKRQKGGDIKFQIVPPKKEPEDNSKNKAVL